MDAVSLDSSSRLIEAFERMSAPQGEGLVSSGPSAVPDALSRAFEQALEQTDTASDGAPGRTDALSPVSPETATNDGMRAERIEADPSSVPAAPEQPLFTPSELYRLQFQVAMLRFQADSGSQVAQKTSQGLDSLLRNQS